MGVGGGRCDWESRGASSEKTLQSDLPTTIQRTKEITDSGEFGQLAESLTSRNLVQHRMPDKHHEGGSIIHRLTAVTSQHGQLPHSLTQRVSQGS